MSDGRVHQDRPLGDDLDEGIARPLVDDEPAIDPADGGDPAAASGGRAASLWADAWRELRHNPFFLVSASVVLLLVVIALFPSFFDGLFDPEADPTDCVLTGGRYVARPSADHPFGYDLQGCDYYAKVIHGTRVSLIIGVIVTTFAVIIALVFGSISGFYGGFIDTLIARITDIWFAIPFILGGIVILSVMRRPEEQDSGILRAIGRTFQWIDTRFEPNIKGLAVVCFVLIILGWPTMLRLMRSSVLSTKEMDYVDAARSLGASDFRIITRHILPNSLAPVIVYSTITVGTVIAAEAALSFLGIGLQLPAISWGLMINSAQGRILQDPHLLIFPGIFLSITVFAFILMGDALRDALDPKLR